MDRTSERPGRRFDVETLRRTAPLRHALLWIGVYVVTVNLGDGASAAVGRENAVTALLLVLLAAALLGFLVRHRLFGRYGLRVPSRRDARGARHARRDGPGDLPRVGSAVRPASQLDDRRSSYAITNEGRGELLWTPAANRLAWTSYLGRPPEPDAAPAYAALARRRDIAGLAPAWIRIGVRRDSVREVPTSPYANAAS